MNCRASVNTQNTFTPSHRLSLIVTAILFLLALPGQAFGERAHLGPWNSFLNQSVVVECTNPTDTYRVANLSIRSQGNQVIQDLPFGLPAFATQHLLLTGIVPQDAYGTYLLTELYPDISAVQTVCSTTTYRYSAPGSPRPVEYAYNLPEFSELRGTTAGIFNSYRPDARPGVVYNWLSVVNLSSTPFSAYVALYGPDGGFNSARSFQMPSLQPGERRDFALGHPDGQQAGIYRLIANDPTQPYSAFVTRFNPEDGGRFSFAFPTLARKPTCEPLTLPASTMDPAFNWAEIANPNPFSQEVVLSIYDSLGIPKSEQHFILNAFSQYHVFLNQYLGDSNVGAFQVRCADSSANDRGLIAESAYYGRRGASVEWAYVTQAVPPAAEGTRYVHFFNSFIGAANWNKLIARDVRGGFGDARWFNGSGQLLRLRSAPLLPNGAVDLPVHIDSGPDAYGMALDQGSTGGAPIITDLLRVFSDTRGGIGYIMNIPPVPIPPSGTQSGRTRVPPSARHFEVGGRPQVIVGESLTQAWMELGDEFKQTEILDALQARGINQFMIWSYIGITDQTADPRIGHDVPSRLWPWPETSGRLTPPYRFLFNNSDLDSLFNPRYFQKLKQLAADANDRGITLIISIHDGWTKQRFDGHPLNVVNGGYLTAREQYVDLADPLNEMPRKWDWNWSPKQRHQWILERFTEEILKATAESPNVLYEVLNEGEWYNTGQVEAFRKHFVDFLAARTSRPVLVNQIQGPAISDYQQNANVDAVTHHAPNWSFSSTAGSSFSYYSNEWFKATTTKPLLFNEPVPSYDGQVQSRTALTRLMWGTLLGRAGFTVQDDASFHFDPNNVDPMIDRLGHAARFWNNGGPDFQSMTPSENLASTGVCLARPGGEYVIYAQESAPSFTLDLTTVPGTYFVRFYSPYTGTFSPTTQNIAGGFVHTIFKPDTNDWVVWVSRIG